MNPWRTWKAFFHTTVETKDFGGFVALVLTFVVAFGTFGLVAGFVSAAVASAIKAAPLLVGAGVVGFVVFFAITWLAWRAIQDIHERPSQAELERRYHEIVKSFTHHQGPTP